jgi:hypothetical protein
MKTNHATVYSSYQLKTEILSSGTKRTRPLSSTHKGSAERKFSMPGPGI